MIGKTQNLKLFASFMDYPRFKLYWYQWKNSASNHLAQSGDGVIVISNGFPNGNWPFYKMHSVLFISHGVSCSVSPMLSRWSISPPDCVKGGVSLLRICERWSISPENVWKVVYLSWECDVVSLLRICERWSISPENVWMVVYLPPECVKFHALPRSSSCAWLAFQPPSSRALSLWQLWKIFQNLKGNCDTNSAQIGPIKFEGFRLYE